MDGFKIELETNAEQACNEVLSLPVFPELEKEEIDYTIENILEFFKAN